VRTFGEISSFEPIYIPNFLAYCKERELLRGRARRGGWSYTRDSMDFGSMDEEAKPPIE
jgi:hypothetical protein